MAATVTGAGRGQVRRAAAAPRVLATRARTYDDSEPDPIGDRVDALLEDLRQVDPTKSPVRDQGPVHHVQSFVVPKHGKPPSLDEVEQARRAAIELDWKVQDMVIVLAQLPEVHLPGLTTGDAKSLGSTGEK